MAAQDLLTAVEPQGRPGMNRRVHIAEAPLVGGDLAVGMEILLGKHEVELLLGEVWVDDREWNGVERQVPGRVPGILPFIGHRDDVGIDHVEPFTVAAGAIAGAERVSAVLVQPVGQVEVVVLLAPEQASQSLAHDTGPVGVCLHGGRSDGLVELVGFRQTHLKHAFELAKGVV